jgi:sterol desaturase/sphingolipid hydroxylase (fatty acid hydroxylase superfamily)
MNLFSPHHSKAAYRADFAFYGIAIVMLAVFLLLAVPHGYRLESAIALLAGLMAWTFVEYAVHRFIFHGLRPYSDWHATHHQQPRALICTPTIVSATLIVILVFLPALVLGNVWCASALALGVSSGLLGYSITHHATHYWRGGSEWLKARKRWHALHHHLDNPGHFGVTSGFWDYVFGSDGRTAAARAFAKQT